MFAEQVFGIEYSRITPGGSDTYPMPVVHPTEEDTPLKTENAGTAQQRRPRLVATVAAVLAVFMGAGLLTSCESLPQERASVIAQVNASRAAAGLRPVSENGWLDLKADKWAQHMRNSCAISHSTLRDGAPANWKKLGENVGRGGSVEAIHVAYMNSPDHRSNVLDPAFNEMGAAAVWGMCPNSQGVPVRTLFTIHVFMKS